MGDGGRYTNPHTSLSQLAWTWKEPQGEVGTLMGTFRCKPLSVKSPAVTGIRRIQRIYLGTNTLQTSSNGILVNTIRYVPAGLFRTKRFIRLIIISIKIDFSCGSFHVQANNSDWYEACIAGSAEGWQ